MVVDVDVVRGASDAEKGCAEERELHARFEGRELGRFVRAFLDRALVEQAAAT